MPYYDIITTYDPNSNQITAFAALATLGESDPFPTEFPSLITLDFSGPASGLILEDALRGGMVDNQGKSMEGNLPLAFEVTGGLTCPTCLGDLNDDGLITGDDVQLLIDAFGLDVSGPEYEPCADFNGDGLITGDDVQLFVSVFSQTCP